MWYNTFIKRGEKMEAVFKNKKAVIFDLDGTLADTVSAIVEAVNMTMDSFSFPTHTDEEVRNAIGNGATTLIRRLVPNGVRSDEALVLRVRKEYDEMYALTYMHSDRMYDGIDDTIRFLKIGRGLKLAVFSNKQDEYVKALCEQYFPDGIIDVARGQTSLPIKPDISGLLKVVEELGVSLDECVYVGDSEVDVKTAENASVDFVGVSWGFVGKDALVAHGATTVIDHPSQLISLIE